MIFSLYSIFGLLSSGGAKGIRTLAAFLGAGRFSKPLPSAISAIAPYLLFISRGQK